MNLEPRTVELSRGNFNSAIESFLRATDVIKDSETPERFDYFLDLTDTDRIKLTISFQQEVNGNQTTVH